jgi:superfamily II DNA or RNA helicase
MGRRRPGHRLSAGQDARRPRAAHRRSGGRRADQARPVSAALKDPAQKNNRDHVDIIIALGMAKEGFDWIWCEHALTVGYRASLTEIVQIIGRATRDAPGKPARFTNLIAEPDASSRP